MNPATLLGIYVIIFIAIIVLLSMGTSCSCEISFPIKLLIATLTGSFVLFILLASIPIEPETMNQQNLYILLMLLMYFGPVLAIIYLGINSLWGI